MSADTIGGTVALLLTALLLSTSPLLGQSDEEDEGGWELGGEAGAALFYGSSEQFAVTVRSEAAYDHSGLEFEAESSFDYGEASAEGEDRIVSNRAWSAEFSVDYDGGAWAPFVEFGSRGSLQRRLDLRTSVGAGTRYRLIRTERSRVDLSLSLAAERTDPRVAPGEVEEIETKGRWSGLLRARHTFGDDRMKFELQSEYEPGLRRFEDDFVVDTEASLSYALTRAVDLQITLENTYDSLAGERGAPSNSDGRIFFLVGASVG